MSHLRTCSLEIRDANAEVLKEAVRLIAETNSLEVTDTIQDYNNNPVKVLTGVKGEATTRGYGVNINKGKIQVVGDDYAQKMRLEQFQTAVNQNYQAVAFARAFRRTGAKAATIRQQGQQIYVTATV